MNAVGNATILVACLWLCACAGSGGHAERSGQPAARPSGFVDRVWRVSESGAVAPGTLYVFLSEGTLVITSPRSKPALGTWRYESGALTMVEEAIAYKVDILELRADAFRIRSHNPGGAVDITLVPAAGR